MNSFPVGWRGSVSQKSIERGHLKPDSRLLHNAMISAEISSVARDMSMGCTTALTASPRSSLATPITATSATAGVGQDHVLDLLRVDVHTAGNDQERFAIHKVEIPFRVDAADIAKRGPAERVAAGGGFRLVIMVGELMAIGEIYLAFRADWQLNAVLVADM